MKGSRGLVGWLVVRHHALSYFIYSFEPNEEQKAVHGNMRVFSDDNWRPDKAKSAFQNVFGTFVGICGESNTYVSRSMSRFNCNGKLLKELKVAIAKLVCL